MEVKKMIFRGVVWVLITGMMTSCASTQNAPQSSSNETIDYEVTAAYLDGVKQRVLKNHEKAEELFLKVLEKEPNHAPANYDLARIEMERGDFPEAEKHIRKAVAGDPENKWYQTTLAEILKEQQKLEESIKVYEQIIDRFESNPRLYFEIAMMYVYLGDYKNAIRYYDKIEQNVGVNERLSIQKQKLYQQLGKKEKAIEELKRLVESQPGNVKYHNLLANLYVEEQQYDKAADIYQKVKEIAPNDAYVHINLADLYRKQGNHDKAFSELKKGFAIPQLDLDTKVQILVTYYSPTEIYSDQKARAFSLAETLVETHPGQSKARSIYGDFLNKDGQQQKALQQFKEAIALDSSRFFNWENYLNILLQQSENEKLIESSESAKELFPMQPVLYLFAGLGHLQLENYQQAQEQLSSGVKLVAGNKGLEAQFNTYLGEAYNELGNYEASDRHFEKAIEVDPENSYTLNNYSYYLSLRGEKLKAAEEYAKKAVRLDPENPNNQDTYGWVLFKMKRYEEAKFWIEKSIKNSDEPSGTVLEHMGDVLFELGEKEQALQYWKRAKEAGDASEDIDKKIEQKKRIAE
jgi:tetratricopeptide (TPR) repeat protein